MRRGYNSGSEIKLELGKMEFDYTGRAQAIYLPKGEYFLQVWGAEGGYDTRYTKPEEGGKGGYSYGYLNLSSDEQIFVYVGGAGYHTDSDERKYRALVGGFNGGGNVDDMSTYDDYNSNHYGGGGGGTDIRINEDSLFSRVIVAGGGGVTSENSYYGGNGNKYGGYGGGTTGSNGYIREYSGREVFGGGPGKQNGSGDNNNEYEYPGTFGYGRNGVEDEVACFPGGGGWYGGGAGSATGDTLTPGGGGSGYIYNSETAQYYPQGCLLTSSYYIKNGETLSAAYDVNSSQFKNGIFRTFPSPVSGVMESGHSGNGFCIISGYARYDKDEDTQIIIPYTKSGTYPIPLGMNYMDVFCVNGGNGGSGTTTFYGEREGYGGRGGNYNSWTGISVGTATGVTITIGAGGNSGQTGGQTSFQPVPGSTSYKPTAQANTPGTTGTSAQNGTTNPFNPLDPNYYGAFGGKGKTESTASINNVGYAGGNYGGGRGGFSAIATSYWTTGIFGGDGSFYGAGGGGGAQASPSTEVPPGKGYQGICIVRYRKS